MEMTPLSGKYPESPTTEEWEKTDGGVITLLL